MAALDESAMLGSGGRPSGGTDDRVERLSSSANSHNDEGSCSTAASPTAPIVNDNGKRHKADENVFQFSICSVGLQLYFICSEGLQSFLFVVARIVE